MKTGKKENEYKVQRERGVQEVKLLQVQSYGFSTCSRLRLSKWENRNRMKYLIVINQKELMRIAPEITESEAIVLDYLIFYCSSINERIDSQRIQGFTWINYQTILDDLPILSGRTPASITEKIKRLEEMGLIQTDKQIDSTTGHARKYIKITDKARSIYADPNQTSFGFLNDPIQKTERPRLENLTNTDTIDTDTKDTKPLPIQKSESASVRQFSDFFVNKYLNAKWNTSHKKYFYSGAKDTKLIKTLLKRFTLDELQTFAVKFFKSDDKFITSSGYTIGVFYSMINKLQVGNTKPKSLLERERGLKYVPKGKPVNV